MTESRHYCGICLHRLSNRQTTSVKMAGGLAEIRAWHLRNANLELTTVQAHSVILTDFFDGVCYYMRFMLRFIGTSSFCQFSVMVYSKKPTSTIIGILNASSQETWIM